MAQLDQGVYDLAALIECIEEAKKPLESAQATLEDLHDHFDADGAGLGGEIIDSAEEAIAAAGEFGDSLTETAGQMAAALSGLETAGQDTAGAAGLPAGDSLMDAGGASFSASCSTAARAITEQGDALGERGFGHALPLLEAAAEGCEKAGELALAKMKGLHAAVDELLPALATLHKNLAAKAHEAADEAEQQAAGFPEATGTAAGAIWLACRDTASTFANLSGELESAIGQRRTEIEAEATRLEEAVTNLLQARNQEAQEATTALLTPVQNAIGAALGGSAAELAGWEGSLGAVAEAAAGLQDLAAQLTSARRVMVVSNATLEEIGKE